MDSSNPGPSNIEDKDSPEEIVNPKVCDLPPSAINTLEKIKEKFTKIMKLQTLVYNNLIEDTDIMDLLENDKEQVFLTGQLSLTIIRIGRLKGSMTNITNRIREIKARTNALIAVKENNHNQPSTSQ